MGKTSRNPTLQSEEENMMEYIFIKKKQLVPQSTPISAPTLPNLWNLTLSSSGLKIYSSCNHSSIGTAFALSGLGTILCALPHFFFDPPVAMMQKMSGLGGSNGTTSTGGGDWAIQDMCYPEDSLGPSQPRKYQWGFVFNSKFHSMYVLFVTSKWYISNNDDHYNSVSMTWPTSY